MTPAPKRQRVFTFLSPKVADVLFYELVPGFTKDPPAFGTAHPDTTRWPNHKLVHVEQADEQGTQDKYFYLASRANQDDYNWEHTEADIGETKFDAVQRTYITLRSDFNPDSPTMGTTMPNTPAGKFSGTHVLAQRKQIRSEDPKLDSLFVIDQRVYVKKVVISEVRYDDNTGRGDVDTVTLYYRGEVATGSSTIEALVADPSNAWWGLQGDGTYRTCTQLSDNWFQVTEASVLPPNAAISGSNPAKTRIYERLTPAEDLMFYETGAMPGTPPTYGTAHYSLTDYKLVHIAPADKSGLLYTFYYAKARATQTGYNYDLSEGGLTVARTYVYLRSSVAAKPSVGTADPTFTDYKFATREIQRFSDEKLDGLFVVVRDIYSKQDDDISIQLDFRPGYKIVNKTQLKSAKLDTATPANRKASSFGEKGWETQIETAVVGTENVQTDIDQKPYVRITSTTTASATPDLPASGSGSSKLTWLNDTDKVYENTDIDSEPIEGPAGLEKDAKPYATFVTNKSYSTNTSLVTRTGSVGVVYNDGETLVYEKGEITVQAREGPAGTEKDQKPFATFETAKSYSLNNTISSATGSSNVVYSDGDVTIYEKGEVTVTARPGPAGQELDKKPFVELRVDKRFSTNPTVSTSTGSSNIVYNDRDIQIYEVSEITATPRSGQAGQERKSEVWGTIASNLTYSTSPDLGNSVGNSRVVYNDGTIQVYELSKETVQPRVNEHVGGKTSSRLVEETISTRYSTSPMGSNGNFRSDAIYNDGNGTIIYKTDSKTIVSKGSVTYLTSVKDSVPSVLKSLDIIPIARKDGRSQNAVWVNLEEGYTGSFPARVTEFYTEDPNASENFTPYSFRPTQISYDGITFNVSIGETLHSAITFTELIGTTDPDYEPQLLSRTVPATEPTDIPTGWVPFAQTVDPYEVGYIIRRIEVKYR